MVPLRVSGAVALALLVSLAFALALPPWVGGPVGVSAQAADDHGDDAASATPLAIPDSASGVLEVAGDVDVFALDLVAGARYVFWTNPTGFNATLELRDAGGGLVGSNSNCEAEGCLAPEQARLELVAAATGTFALAITSSGGAGSYSLFAKDQTPQPLPTPPVTTISVSNDLDFTTDRDEWLFDLVAGTLYVFWISPSGFDATLELRDPSGTLVASNSDCLAVGCTTGSQARIELTPLASGEFTLTVRAIGVHRDYVLFAKEQTPRPFPSPSVPSVSVSDRLNFTTDRDEWLVDLVAGTPYVFWINPTGFDATLELRDPSGALLEVNSDCLAEGCTTDGQARIELVPLASGEFTLTVRAIGVHRDYVLFAKVQTPQPFPAPTVPSVSLADRLNFTTDRDEWLVELVAGTPYVFWINPTGFDASLELRDPSGALVEVNSDCLAEGCTTDRQAQIELIPMASGEFSLTVRATGVHRDYVIFAKDLTPQPFPLPNPAGVRVDDRLAFLLDRDVYELDLTSGIPALLFGDGPTNQHLGLRLTDADGALIATNEDCTTAGCTGAHQALLELPAGQSQVVLLTVFRRSGSPNAYTIWGKDLTPQPFPTPTGAGVSIVDRLNFLVDRDVYLVDLAVGDTSRFFAQPPGTLNVALELRGPGGGLLAFDQDCTTPPCAGSFQALIETPVPRGGGHILTLSRVSGIPASYSIDAAVEPATPLGVPDRLEADITDGLDADTDVYVVQLEAGERYVFYERRKQGSGNGRLVLLDATGAVLDVDEQFDEGLIPFIPDASGTYFLRIEGPARRYQIYTDHDAEVVLTLGSDTAGAGELPLPSDVDVFTVELVAGQRVLAFVEGHDSTPLNSIATTVAVFDPDGIELGRNDDCSSAGCLGDSDSLLVFVAEQSGTHSLSVAHSAVASDEFATLSANGYTLRLRELSDQPLPVPGEVEGAFEFALSPEEVAYTLDLIESAQYEFRLHAEEGALGVLLLEDADGRVIASDSPCDEPGCAPGDRVLRFDALEGGSAVLRVTRSLPLLTGSFRVTAGLAFPRSITIVVEARPSSNRDFLFVADGLPVLGFALDDPFANDGDGVGRSISFDPLAAGPGYAIDQLTPFGWELLEISCSGAESSTVTVRSSGVTIALAGTDAVTCVFVNIDRDADDDGLTDDQEQLFGTDAFNPDSDGDGVDDGRELLVDDTDPRQGGQVGSCAPAFTPPIAPVGWTFTRYTCEDTTVDELLQALASAGATSVTIAMPSGETVTGVSTRLPFVNVELHAMFPDGVRGGTLLAVRGLGPRSFR